jgi:hypothetical protein
LGEGSGESDTACGKEVLQREMQPNAEHQENDADLGEVTG